MSFSFLSFLPLYAAGAPKIDALPYLCHLEYLFDLELQTVVMFPSIVELHRTISTEARNCSHEN